MPFDNAREKGLQLIHRTEFKCFSENALDWGWEQGEKQGVSAPMSTEQSLPSHGEHPDPREMRSSKADWEEGRGAVTEAKLY